jgi:putative inorganic carbon (hco3(-)) transporter
MAPRRVYVDTQSDLINRACGSNSRITTNVSSSCFLSSVARDHYPLSDWKEGLKVCLANDQRSIEHGRKDMDQNSGGELAPIVPNNLVGTEVRQHRRPYAQASGSIATAVGRLYSLSPKAIWDFLKRQSPSYWLVCIYLFFEYVRPQQIYEAILGPPYARIAILLALAAFLLERRRFRFGIPEFLLAIFSFIVLVSSFTAFDPSISYDKLTQYFSWVLIYLLIANTVTTEGRFLVLMLSFLLYSTKMSQFGTRSWAEDGFAFRSWGTTGSPGWFQNSGEFGIQMCIFLPLIVAFIMGLEKHWPRWLRWVTWLVAATAIIGVVASSSRGAFIGAAAVIVWLLLKSRNKLRTLLVTLAVVGLVYAITPAQQKIRFENAGEDKTSVSRITMWKQGVEMMRDHPITGVGYANWLKYDAVYYGGTGLLVHNTFIQAGSELGYPGLVIFLALVACTFVINRKTRKLTADAGDRGRFIFYMAHGLDGALVGFIASGFFISVLYYPFFWINFAMTVALHNAALAGFPPGIGLPPVQHPSAWRSARAVRPRS